MSGCGTGGAFYGAPAGSGSPGMASRQVGGGLVVDPPAGSKRSLLEWQLQQQRAVLMRSVKPRLTSHHTSPISPLSPLSPELSTASSAARAYHFPAPTLPPPPPVLGISDSCPSFNGGAEPAESAKKMKSCLQELERQLLDDDDDDNQRGCGGFSDSGTASAISSVDLSETMQNLIGAPTQRKSLSPSSSSSSSSPSVATAAPQSLKHLLQEAAVAISEGEVEQARGVLARFNQSSAAAMTWTAADRKLAASIAPALLHRIDHPSNPNPSAKFSQAGLHQLHEASPCFNLGFIAAGLAILEATQNQPKIHIVDFDIGHGSLYFGLLRALSNRTIPKPSLRITAIADPALGSHLPEPFLRLVGDRLKKAADSLGLDLRYAVATPSAPAVITREALGVEMDEALAVCFAYRLYRVPDESVSTANPRDELLRRARSMLPAVVVMAEQELGANTAPFLARLTGSLDYYGSVFDSLDRPVQGLDPRLEELLGRKAANAVAAEGVDRVERCEPFGKWCARMSMAGLKPRPISTRIAESVRARLAAATKTSSSFFIKEEGGGLFFGWNGRPLTVVSAWH